MWGRWSSARLLMAMAAASLSGCGIAKFETTIADQATIPGTFQMAPLGLGYGAAFNDLHLDTDKSFTNAGVKPSDVNTIFVKSVHVEATMPERDRLDVILASMKMFVEAPGVDKQQIAWIDAFPMGAAADLMVDSTINLKPYATAPSMKVSAEVVLKKAPLFPTTIKTIVTLAVDPHVL
jgi:hypothetical protein